MSSNLTASANEQVIGLYERHAEAWVLADVRNLALQRRFHGIIAWDSFFHLTPGDQCRVIPIFRARALSGSHSCRNRSFATCADQPGTRDPPLGK